MATYELKADTRQIKILLARTAGPFGSPDVADELGQGVREWGVALQTRAVHNVSGYPVVYQGGSFVVRVRTGALKSAIELQWPYQTAFQARVFVNGTVTGEGTSIGGRMVKPAPVSQYAFAIEMGHDEIDLKKTMRGKIVPFFGARAARATGPYAARGLQPVEYVEGGLGEMQTGAGSMWASAEHNRKLQAKGKGPMYFTKKGGQAAYAKGGGSVYFISFRRVGDTGWVIPAAKPRPFLRAALEGTKDAGRLAIARHAKKAFTAS